MCRINKTVIVLSLIIGLADIICNAQGFPPRRGPAGKMGAGGGPGRDRRAELPMPPRVTTSSFDKSLMEMTENSPFGFKDPNMLRVDLFSWYDDYGKTMNDLGVHWMEPAASFGFSWKQVQEKNIDGSYTQFNWERYDRLVEHAQSYNIHISGIIHASEPVFNSTERIVPSLPLDINGYQNFVKALVERYDGDGMEDMPHLLYPVKYWKIEDEAMMKIFFKGTGSDYAIIVNAAYDAIKSVDEDARVILSMIRNFEGISKTPNVFMEEFFRKSSELSNKRKWDIMDQHWMMTDPAVLPGKQYLGIQRYINDVNTAAAKYGFETVPFWAMEVIGVGTPEKAHAIDMFKRYIYAFSIGVKKVFWSGLAAAPMKEGLNVRGGGIPVVPFMNATLIDPQGSKKLGYYTYKKMVEILEGSDLGRIQTIKAADDIYIFKFLKNNKPVWIAWNDGGADVKEKIEMQSGIKKVTVTEAVPMAGSGNDVKGADIFKKSEIAVSEDFVIFEIKDVPLIITVD